MSQVLWLCRKPWKVNPRRMGWRPRVLPSAAGRKTRRRKVERHSQVPEAVVNTNPNGWLSRCSRSRSTRNAGRRRAFWVGPATVVPGFVECTEVRVDGEGAALEVELAAVQAGEFAPPAAGPHGRDDQQVRYPAAERAGLFSDGHDLFRGGPDPFRDDPAGASSAAAAFVDGVGRDEVLVGGVGEDHRQQVEQAGHGGGGVALSQGFGPEADVEGGDGVEGRSTEPGQDVAA
jgi:hypothetical protein